MLGLLKHVSSSLVGVNPSSSGDQGVTRIPIKLSKESMLGEFLLMF